MECNYPPPSHVPPVSNKQMNCKTLESFWSDLGSHHFFLHFFRMGGWLRQVWHVKFVCGVWAQFKLHPLHRSMFALIFADSTIPRWGWMKKTLRKINGECNQGGGALIAIQLPSSSHYGYLGPSVLSRAQHNNWFTSQNHWSDTSSNARPAVIEKKLKALLN